MMTEQEWHDYLLSFDRAKEDNKSDQKLNLFRIGEEGAIFAGIEKSSQPVRVSLRCDSQLARNLRQKYETVLPARQFNPSTWNTVIITGQLSEDEVKDLIRLSYNLTAER